MGTTQAPARSSARGRDDLPIATVTAEPIWSRGNIIDLAIRSVNEHFRIDQASPAIIGESVTKLVPDLFRDNFLGELLAIRDHPDQSIARMRFSRQGSPYHLIVFWDGDTVCALSTEVNVSDFAELGIGYATKLVTKVLPETPVLYSIHTRNTKVQVASDVFLRNLNLTNETLAEFDLLSRVDSLSSAQIRAALNRRHTTIEPIRVAVRLENGTERWHEVWISRIENGAADLGTFTIVRDIDDLYRSVEREKTMRQEAEQARTTLIRALNLSSEGFAIWSACRAPSGEIAGFTLEFMNESGAQPSGKAPSEIQGRDLSEILPDEYDHLFTLFCSVLESQKTELVVVEMHGLNGWVGEFENRVAPLSSDRLVASYRDVSEDRKQRRQLDYRVNHDLLTGLLSRAGLQTQWRFAANEDEHDVVLAFMDLDDFKSVNDTRGHSFGDRLLQELGRALTDHAHPSDTVCRLSGDEFVWMRALRAERIETIAQQMLEVLSAPVPVEGELVNLTVSIGIAVCRNTDPLDDVLSAADRAMYDLKRNGKAGLRITELYGDSSQLFA